MILIVSQTKVVINNDVLFIFYLPPIKILFYFSNFFFCNLTIKNTYAFLLINILTV